jgi:hypothetical protein
MRFKPGDRKVDDGLVVGLVNQEETGGRARVGYLLAVGGATLAIGGVLLGILFSILSHAWSGEIACDGIQSWVLNFLPGAAAMGLCLGLLLGTGAIILDHARWRAGVSAVSLALVGSVIAFLAIASSFLGACS